MPKIRALKPDFWTDDAIVELSPLARLLFQGLWTYACDNGHVEDKPRQIKMRILPADEVKVGDLLDELSTSGRITREAGWIAVPNFSKHQKIDKRFFTVCERPGCARPGENPPTSQPESRGGHVEPTSSAHRGHNAGTARPRVGHVSSLGGFDGDGDGVFDGDSEVDGDVGRSLALAEPPQVVAAEVSAQSLVAEWIDHCTDRPPGRVIGQVAKELKSMLTEGVSPDRIRPALAEWNRKGLHPSTLASVVHEVANRAPTNRGQQATDDLFAAAMERAIERDRSAS